MKWALCAAPALTALAIAGCLSSSDSPQPSAADAGPGGNVPGLDAGTSSAEDATAVTVVCPTHSGPGTTHAGDTITAETVWRAADSPHIVPYDFRIASTGTLTLEPCAEVRMKAGRSITVDGKLVADGTASQPIHLLADDPAKPWSYIRFLGGTGRFAYATIENGGAVDPNGLGLIEVRGSANVPQRQELVRMDHVTLKASQRYGLSLRENGTLTSDSNALTITGAALEPIRTWPGLAGNIPPGAYTGNGVDAIAVLAEDGINEDTTWHARGVPYHLGDPVTKNGADLRVGRATTGAPKVTFTVEPGVTIEVAPAGRILTSSNANGSTGVLVAAGTAGEPIVFTSTNASPVAGDWVGLWFSAPDAAHRIDHARVEYAGGPSFAESFHCSQQGDFNEAEDASILVFGLPPSAFVTNSVIAFSAGYGIGRAWTGSPVDFLPTNTFDQTAKCKESYPRQAGACPTPVPCP